MIRHRVWGGMWCLSVLPGKGLLLEQMLLSGVKIDAVLSVPGSCSGWL